MTTLPTAASGASDPTARREPIPATHPIPLDPMTTLPTIHLNGTGADTLRQEYRAVRKAVDAAAEQLTSATCNGRDFYPQVPSAWQQARDERAEMFRLLQRVSEYAERWELHAMEHCRR